MAGLWLLGSCGVPLAQAQTRTADANAPTLLVLGDSLSAEYGLRRGSGWVALLERKLATEKSPVQVVNASVSGDTTSGGRSRLPGLLQEHRPAVVVIELGGNDALRGLSLDLTRDNLSAIAQRARASGAKVLLLGMQMPPNYGARYGKDFAQLFADVAKAERTALVPFFLKGVVDGLLPLALFQPDRIHPNEKAQPIMLDNVWPALRPLLPRSGR
ncbi:arylesterase [Macromonas bipunctata]|uniref:arylesterase n=1 Tax=Macromonas bipunctata TaxID=183670 RepID=UPI000C3394A5|nr:arylesterase [Macromonas bipunctata]